MLGKLLPFFDDDPGAPSLWEDLRSGQAGFWPRLGLSLGAALALLALAIFGLGLLDLSDRRVDEEHVAAALGLAGAAWCVALFFIWGSYRRFRRAIRTAFGVLTVWAVALPMIALIIALVPRDGEFFIISIVLLAGGITLAIISTAMYRGTGRPLRNTRGDVNVRCAQCGYSMVGLTEPACPECGRRYTIDELFEAQGYATNATQESIEPETDNAEKLTPRAI